MKRILKIILVILLIIAIILVVAWLRSRHTAKEQGTQASNFRQFLGLGTVTPPEQTTTPGTGLSPDFTQSGDTSTSTNTPDGTTESGTTTTSQFTSGPISPTQSSSGNTNSSGSSLSGSSSNGGSFSGSSGGSSTTTGSSSGSGNTTTQPPAPGPGTVVTTAATSQCTDADLTIQFTSEEITRLNALQNRFYAIAGTLHGDEDVKNEVANHDEFKAKADQITELYNYCVGQSPKIGGTLYINRVTTPFWRDAARDGAGYMIKGSNDIPLTTYAYDPRDPSTDSVIERIFKLSLW